MARFVFFSFAYEDVKNFKVNIIRNNWLLKNSEDSFVDGSIWEKSKEKKTSELKSLIEYGLLKTSVTVVLIGQNTSGRRWVNYEIIKSFEKGNGILAVYINRVKGKTGLTRRGKNPLDRLGFLISEDGKRINFFELKNGKWENFKDLPSINNKKSNTLYFGDSWLWGNEYGQFYRLSDKFSTYCWKLGIGNDNFSDWIEKAASQAGR